MTDNPESAVSPADDPSIPAKRWEPHQVAGPPSVHLGGPRRRQRIGVGRPLRRSGRPPSIRRLLADYDSSIEVMIGELDLVDTGLDRVRSFHRLQAAISIHDSVLRGVLCPLLESLPGGTPLATQLREGCEVRGKSLRSWERLIHGVEADELYDSNRDVVEDIIEALVDSFEQHKSVESADVTSFLENPPEIPRKIRGDRTLSLLWGSGPRTWIWPDPHPGMVAAYTDLWAETAPLRVHYLTTRYPTNRLLKRAFKGADRWNDWRNSRHGWPRLS
jgi:hypothetical protein